MQTLTRTDAPTALDELATGNRVAENALTDARTHYRIAADWERSIEDAYAHPEDLVGDLDAVVASRRRLAEQAENAAAALVDVLVASLVLESEHATYETCKPYRDAVRETATHLNHR